MIFSRIVAGLFALLLSCSLSMADMPVLNEFVVEGNYEDVRFDLDDAIVSRGLSVDHISHVSDMLQRTADVVDGARQIYKRGEQFQFCSAILSRAAMQADPANISFCPYMIFLYERVDEPGRIHLGFRRLNERGNASSRKALMAVNSLLMGIIQEVSGN